MGDGAARLPLPSAVEVRDVACRLVAARPGIGSDDLEAAVAAHFGVEVGQEPQTGLFERVFDVPADEGLNSVLPFALVCAVSAPEADALPAGGSAVGAPPCCT